MDKIYNIIRADLITINGGKNNMRGMVILITVMFGAMGFIISPIAGIYCPFEFGCFFVPMLFQNEQKYHSEKMYSIIPIERKDLVRSRFILTTGIYTVMSLIFYILMLISLKLGLYTKFMEGEDIIKIMLRNLSGFSTLGFFNLIYFTSFAIGLSINASSLRKYFKDSKYINTSLKKIKDSSKEEIFAIIFIFAVIVTWILIVSGIIPLGSSVALILGMILQLAQTADGFLLGAVIISTGIFSVIYKYICTVLEYDTKEL